MPYNKRKVGENWEVFNTETEEVKSTFEPPEAEERADRQVRLLNEIEKDPQWDEDDGEDDD